ncbi:hypothetical protein Q7O_000760 [Pectobacterium carotovorum subsp. carotovorum PCCS1]|nr:hypothetical protein [Pectobacterium carotovorum subsp. carotovorum PCCS1]
MLAARIFDRQFGRRENCLSLIEIIHQSHDLLLYSLLWLHSIVVKSAMLVRGFAECHHGKPY